MFVVSWICRICAFLSRNWVCHIFVLCRESGFVVNTRFLGLFLTQTLRIFRRFCADIFTKNWLLKPLLVMPRREGRILLGMKKRGFGEGRLVPCSCYEHFVTFKVEWVWRQGRDGRKRGRGSSQRADGGKLLEHHLVEFLVSGIPLLQMDIVTGFILTIPFLAKSWTTPVRDIEVTSVKNILFGGREEGVCYQINRSPGRHNLNRGIQQILEIYR